MSKKPLIVFEGIEASGKSTSLQKAINYLKKNKIKYIAFREPGGTKFSEDLRSLILNKKSKLNNKTDLFLLMASRSENIDKILKKNLK
ncbi:thymidylate kinase, partial [Candidatus Pelagibacter sp.]|nr:thymidylate kinase [Candidatus Pelagibacter sp.]